MRPHYHIWLIGAVCALAVLVVASIFSLLDARDPGGVGGARTTPTSVLIATAPPGDLSATALDRFGGDQNAAGLASSAPVRYPR
jgi:hypothetical protein